MSVINTNYLALVSQNNLVKSQNALGQAIERLSSGLRINSAKDDAAGQAIANRFTANVNGLTQAARNANDGISIAQTTEGSLNEINENLQRIRTLSVQAANGSNSADDLTSIQNEIQERLDEIDRVSRETQFNGKYVLGEDGASLSVQVGAHDNQRIEINLSRIDSNTLGLNGYNVNGLKTSDFSAPLTKAGTGTSNVTVSLSGNAATPPTGPVATSPSGITADGVYALADDSGYVVKSNTGEYFDLTENPATGNWVWDSSTAAVDAADVKVASGPVTDVVRTVATPTITVVDSADGTAGNNGVVAVTAHATNPAIITFNAGAIYTRNDTVGANGLAEYAIEGSDGNYYALTATRDAANDEITFAIDENTLVQVSEENVNTTPATTVEMERVAAPTPDTDLLNEDLTIPTAQGTGVYALTDGSGDYAVKGSNNNYYAATLNADGSVDWDSSTGALNKAIVDETTAITSIANAPVTGSYTGLASGETLHSYEDAEGVTQYAVKSGTGENAVYTKATIGTADPATGDIAVTKATGDDATLSLRSENPLKSLDDALQQVDDLRSHLGAIQNRFESTIANLSNTVNNLSAARSRIEDADYAVEVSNMTRAQILQQAGTSVLAQANQIPQTVLSLLR